jgi:hypothetical protein
LNPHPVPLTPWTHRSGSSLSSRAQARLDRGKEIPAAAPESFMILALLGPRWLEGG